ncbi:hypothetical protein RJ639_025996 [Escallonia herrerae]|uniref:Uncharacterized protein n=1 Tax=Escallonia herrerae TaxID=1293975 RepID=A0AA89ABU7_9ASTE|nr:hypothetical protein RJ639_025996 [Escallonia herrerae]
MLRKEKNMLRESKSQSFELIRRLEAHVKTLSEVHFKDKKHIQELERELSNCSQEIVKGEIASLGALKGGIVLWQIFGLCLVKHQLWDLDRIEVDDPAFALFPKEYLLKLFLSIMIFLPDYLQDQLHARNAEVNSLRDHVHSLELKLTDFDKLEDIVGSVSKELQRSNSERLILTRKLESKEQELQKSTSHIEKLEDSIASVALEYQCEIESMKLDLLDFEHSCFEANKIREEAAQEKSRVQHLIQDFKLQIQDYQEVIERLDEENRELREKLNTAEMNAKGFCQKMEETFPELMETKNALSSSSEFETNTSTCGYVLGPLLSRLSEGRASDAELKEKLKEMSCQIHKYELLITKLKEELREEKVKSKEEAEDLTQEMAELRYQISGLLEEECKRRACIEQISLQRIAKLEAQIEKQQLKSWSVIQHIPGA